MNEEMPKESYVRDLEQKVFVDLQSSNKINLDKDNVELYKFCNMDRNEILANFQACTGLENITDCIAILEQTDWNLQEAVNIGLATAGSPVNVAENLSISGSSVFPSFGGQDDVVEPCQDHPRMINFEIKLNDNIKHISLDDTATLKMLHEIVSIELQIPENEAVFDGWPNPSVESLSESTMLNSLQLPENVSLTVRSQINGATSSSAFGLRNNVTVGTNSPFMVPCPAFRDNDLDDLQKLRETYILEIKDARVSGTIYNLTCIGSKTFEELKYDAHSLTGIKPSEQSWEGLTFDPADLSNDRTLGSLGLDVPIHKCSVTQVKNSTASSSVEEAMDVEELDDFEDASDNFHDDMIFSTEVPSAAPILPLMPAQATDEVAALAQFQSEFNTRYGDVAVTPQFAIGSLSDAIQEAFGGSARNRKLLAIYLHHDNSIQSNVFCSQLLCAQSVVEYLSTHCVVWAWDVTTECNRSRFLDICTTHLGSGVSNTVRKVSKDEFPMLLLAHGRGRACEVNSIIQGNTSLNELMAKLIKAVEDAEHQKQEDVLMEEMSEARERIKKEQEEAYEESLQKDIDKQKKIEEEIAERERKEQEEKLAEERKHNEIQEYKKMVPDEPSADSPHPVTKIRFRPPCGGDLVTRTFLASNLLQDLLNFVASLGYLPEKYRVISSWPKREISNLDPSISLKDHKLFPQETLIIEERLE